MAWRQRFTSNGLPGRVTIKRLVHPLSTRRRRHLKLFVTYIPDWIILILINVAGALFGKLGPRHREFSLHDYSIQYSYHESYVPDFVPPLVAYAAPVISALAFLVFRRHNWHDFHCTVLAIFMAMGLNNTATNILKNAVGRPRPDFIFRCQPNVTENPPLRLVDYRVCTQSDLNFLHEGMRSFPSGHASLSFCGLTFTSLYLASHFRYNDQRGHAYKTIVFYLPLFCATLISISRTADYHHHWQDVLAGALLGTFVGWFGYRTYFPQVFDPNVLSDRPYPRRITRPNDVAEMRRRSHVLPVDDDPYQMSTPSCASNSSGNARAASLSGNHTLLYPSGTHTDPAMVSDKGRSMLAHSSDAIAIKVPTSEGLSSERVNTR
ncbi:hypothetical protein H4R24_004427 [Coemansia sp. RSA 988]|nr:hypothetical protein H4R24_004427 [Coemansia sp. RSA 988]